MDCSPPGSSVRGILQARMLEWVAMPSLRGSSQPGDWTASACVSCIAGILFISSATWEAHYTWSVQFSSVTQSFPTPCDPMDCSTPGFPVHYQLPAFTQTHVHWVGDAIQPSHPLSSLSPSAFNLSQQQGLFKWVSSSHQVAKVLEFQLQHQSFPVNIQDWFPLGWTCWISLQP